MGSTVRKRRCGDQRQSSLICTFEIIDMNLSSDNPSYHTKPQAAVVQSTHIHVDTFQVDLPSCPAESWASPGLL